jgi:hypothetical protein
MEDFMSIFIDAGLMIALVLFVEQIKKFQGKETIKVWGEKNVYLLIYAGLCIPLAILTSMKDGVFDADVNTTLAAIGITFRTFFIMATVGSFLYDAIIKKARKKKEEIANSEE